MMRGTGRHPLMSVLSVSPRLWGIKSGYPVTRQGPATSKPRGVNVNEFNRGEPEVEHSMDLVISNQEQVKVHPSNGGEPPSPKVIMSGRGFRPPSDVQSVSPRL